VVQLGGVITSHVFNKALVLSPAARQTRTIGEIVNYMQARQKKRNKMKVFKHQPVKRARREGA
jgi:hypothetical protein